MLHKTFRHDLQAALAITLLGIPQAIAYAMIAGLPPVAGAEQKIDITAKNAKALSRLRLTESGAQG